MNPEVKQKWLEFLDKNEINQQISYLGKVDENGVCSHCILGTLCELYIQETGDESIKKIEETTGLIWYSDNASILPTKVGNWAELTPVGSFTPTEENRDLNLYLKNRYSLASMNDGGVSFSKLKTVIRDYF